MAITDQKRPRARNARPKIEKAALELFIRDGVDAATTRNIADNAGVSEGALYRHYKGKDELALALFMETHDDPSSALSDPNTVLDLQYLEFVLSQARDTHLFRQELQAKYGEDNVHTN